MLPVNRSADKNVRSEMGLGFGRGMLDNFWLAADKNVRATAVVPKCARLEGRRYIPMIW
jgi:hypothetical protein